MTKKANTIYKIIVALTLLLPISSFLIISAIFSQPFDYEIFAEETAVIEFTEYEDGYVVYAEEASYNGYLIPYNEEYALYIENGDVVKIDNDYFTPYFNDEIGEYKLTNYNDIPPTPQQNRTWTISIASIVALGIVGLIIGGKMDLLKKHPRISALVSLAVITAILYGLNSIISDMLTVFLIATISWFGYCLEYAFKQGTISAKESEKIQTDLINGLKEMLK